MAPGLLITTPNQCTSSWARTVTGLSHPRAKVSGVEVASVESGTTTRVRLRVSHDEPEIPRRWFVKLPSRRLRARLITALPRLVDTEIRFYQQLANDVGVGVPRALAAQRSLLKATLVLEDLGDTDCMLVEPAASFSITQARGAVRLLAHLHRRFLDCPRFETDLAWLEATATAKKRPKAQRIAAAILRAEQGFAHANIKDAKARFAKLIKTHSELEDLLQLRLANQALKVKAWALAESAYAAVDKRQWRGSRQRLARLGRLKALHGWGKYDKARKAQKRFRALCRSCMDGGTDDVLYIEAHLEVLRGRKAKARDLLTKLVDRFPERTGGAKADLLLQELAGGPDPDARNLRGPNGIRGFDRTDPRNGTS